jgi:hypothetical protein
MPARDAYAGQAFRMARRHLELGRHKWCILSGGLGFLWPTTWIEDYDAKMPAKIDPGTWEPFNLLTDRQYGRLLSADRIVVLGSRRYAAAAAAFLNREVEAPLAGLPIGRMLSELSRGLFFRCENEQRKGEAA